MLKQLSNQIALAIEYSPIIGIEKASKKYNVKKETISRILCAGREVKHHTKKDSLINVDTSKYISIADKAREMDLSQDCLNGHIRKRGIPTTTFGNYRYFSLETDVVSYIPHLNVPSNLIKVSDLAPELGYSTAHIRKLAIKNNLIVNHNSNFYIDKSNIYTIKSLINKWK